MNTMIYKCYAARIEEALSQGTALRCGRNIERHQTPLPLMPSRPHMASSVLDLFHPAVRAWFESAFAAPTPAQVDAWPAIQAGRHVLVAAPTGSGKTLAAFLAAIDSLVREALACGGALPDETRIVYVSPLKALSNDIQRNLEVPLDGIRAELKRMGLPEAGIRSAVRTGDTPQREREQMRRRFPHIVVTTPEIGRAHV